jgi:photoactive yellow protein
MVNAWSHDRWERKTVRENLAPSFDEPRLAEAVERLPPDAVDALPYGAIRLDAQGIVTFFSATERKLCGLRREALGQPFFLEIAPCMDNPEFRGRIEKGRLAGRLDVAFGYVSDMPGGAKDVALDVRVQAAADGGTWIFLRRDG